MKCYRNWSCQTNYEIHYFNWKDWRSNSWWDKRWSSKQSQYVGYSRGNLLIIIFSTWSCMDTIEYEFIYLNRYQKKETTFAIFLRIILIQHKNYVFSNVPHLMKTIQNWLFTNKELRVNNNCSIHFNLCICFLPKIISLNFL